ncbi:MAG: imidazole glycerol phosphate synthase subunit HisF [Phycisphaeraceae bacterium]|nr:MAG: imidazole glycerol phosphate synthase subunit HisF [Phycisphaeraceae bacterium]
MKPSVAVIRTGSANLASVVACLARLGARAVITQDPAAVASSPRVVLPGVGSFASAAAELRRLGLTGVLQDRLLAGRPTLGICLGLQLLASSSDESPGAPGLRVIDRRVERLAGPARVPQMGWRRVEPWGLWAYYANSYALRGVPEGWGSATGEHGGPFVAALWRGGVLACQFHPELSGHAGASLLHAWLVEPDREWSRWRPPAGDAAGQRTPDPARVIPCLDVRDGRIVKGVRFENLRDAGDPADRAAAYERDGADELVILDVAATAQGRAAAARTVEAVRRQVSIPLTVGGGVRTPDDAARLLDAGADKVAVNSAAVENPGLITQLADRFGRQCVVAAIDAARAAGRDGWEVVTRSGATRTGIDALAWARDAQRLGTGEILLTSLDRDGTGEGYDLGLLSAVTGSVGVPVIASGGVRTATDLAAAWHAGATGLLAATIFHDGHSGVASVKNHLTRLGVPVRPAPIHDTPAARPGATA